jgi:hypothetical protein
VPTYNKICRKGRCVCPPDLPDECQFECINLQTSTKYCGTCGNVCSPGTCCVYFASLGYRHCSTTDLDSDRANCGACGRKCAVESTCCGARCTNVETDPRNCGACGKSCAPGEVCCSGFCANLHTDSGNCGSCDHSCYLAGGFKDGRNDCCGGKCVNRQGDVTNCGYCGRRCSDGEVCVQGRCVEDIPVL